MRIGGITMLFAWLTGLLWYERPSDGTWLLGSLALGIGWGAAFLWLITRVAKL